MVLSPLSPALSSPSRVVSSRSPSLFLLFLQLIFISLLNTNNYFAYHAPGAIASDLSKSYPSIIQEKEIGYMFTLYSLPNTIMVLIGGILIDRYGIRFSSLFFNVIILLSALLFALAPYLSPSNPLTYFYISRFLLGIGGECIVAAGQSMIVRWFQKVKIKSKKSITVRPTSPQTKSIHLREQVQEEEEEEGEWITFGMGFMNAFVQLIGSALSFYLLPRLVIWFNLQWTYWFIVFICCLSLIANLFFNWMDVYYRDYRKSLQSSSIAGKVDETAPFLPTYIQTASSIQEGHAYQTFHSPVLYPSSPPSSPSFSHPAGGSGWEGFTSILSDITKLPPLFYLIAFMQLWLTPILYTFTAFGPLFFIEKWNMTNEEAGTSTSILYLTIIVAPLAGYFIDRLGYSIYFQIFASFLIAPCFFLLQFTYIHPSYIMYVMGFLFAITESNGFAMVGYVVPIQHIGSAYGLMSSIFSIALFIEPALVGYIKLYTGSFFWSNTLFIFLATLGCINATIIAIYDLKHERRLTMSASSSR